MYVAYTGTLKPRIGRDSKADDVDAVIRITGKGIGWHEQRLARAPPRYNGLAGTRFDRCISCYLRGIGGELFANEAIQQGRVLKIPSSSSEKDPGG